MHFALPSIRFLTADEVAAPAFIGIHIFPELETPVEAQRPSVFFVLTQKMRDRLLLHMWVTHGARTGVELFKVCRALSVLHVVRTSCMFVRVF